MLLIVAFPDKFKVPVSSVSVLTFKNNPSISSYEVFELLSITDIKDAANLLLETYDSTHKLDGYVSIEVSPDLAHDTDKTVNQAIHLHKKINMPNILIKVPATK